MIQRRAVGILLGCLVLTGCGGDDPTENENLPPDPVVVTISSADYLRHTFYFLDLPESRGLPVHDVPGRQDLHRIDHNSVQIFRRRPEDGWPPGPHAIQNVAAYLDTTGVFWSTEDSPDNDFQTPMIYGGIWIQVEFDLYLLDHAGLHWGIALDEGVGEDDILAVHYQVVDQYGFPQYKVGDRPGWDEIDQVFLPGEPDPFYRMKLLKAPTSQQQEYAFFYELRNIYSLGFFQIDPDIFTLTIERSDGSEDAHLDENGLPYNQLFGVPGIDDNLHLDLARGLFRFPELMPFNAGEEAHRLCAAGSPFQWEDTYLAGHQAPELYQPHTLPADYPQYGYFTIRVIYQIPASE